MGNRGQLIISQYTGNKSLSFLCTLTSLSIDQINFLACQFAALVLSCILRKHVRDPNTRLIYCLISGLFICNFCFGVQIFHVIASAGLSYLVMRRSTSSNMPWFVLAVSLLYLSWLHVRRQFFGYADGLALDITGPMMVLTQKVTSLAFAVNDGRKQKAGEKITELQINHVISDIPDTLEYWSYIFQFQCMLAGPLVFFKEYREFIFMDQCPSPSVVVLKKLGGSMFFALLYLKVAPQYQMDNLREEHFLQTTSVFQSMVFITFATTLERTKYYHAWILSDAVCNASGLGYNRKSKTWDLVTNVNALQFERSTNLKEALDLWNIGTMRWLRYVVYERFDSGSRTIATYTTSAFWHGFYPGYYITFFSGALFTSAARAVRRTVRPIFIKNRVVKFSYDFVTWLTTRIVVSYVSFPFVLLDLIPSIRVYLRLYFFLHFAAVGSITILPSFARNIKVSSFSKLSSNFRLSNQIHSKDTLHFDNDGKYPIISKSRRRNDEIETIELKNRWF